MNAETDEQDEIFEHLMTVARTGSEADIKDAVASLHPADVAELINVVEPFEAKENVFHVLAPDAAPAVLSQLLPSVRERIVPTLSVDSRNAAASSSSAG